MLSPLSGLDDQLGDAPVPQSEPESQIDDATREVTLEMVHRHCRGPLHFFLVPARLHRAAGDKPGDGSLR